MTHNDKYRNVINSLLREAIDRDEESDFASALCSSLSIMLSATSSQNQDTLLAVIKTGAMGVGSIFSATNPDDATDAVESLKEKMRAYSSNKK